MTPDPFVIWCAGFFDGEGSICIALARRQNARCQSAASQFWLQISLTQNVREPLDSVKALFGGRIARLSQPPNKKLTRPLWRWVADADVAVNFLRAVRPHLRIKGRGADIAFEFQATMKQHMPNLTTEQRTAARVPLKQALEDWNRRPA